MDLYQLKIHPEHCSLKECDVQDVFLSFFDVVTLLLALMASICAKRQHSLNFHASGIAIH
jgi:hypothetical protein